MKAIRQLAQFWCCLSSSGRSFKYTMQNYLILFCRGSYSPFIQSGSLHLLLKVGN